MSADEYFSATVTSTAYECIFSMFLSLGLRYFFYSFAIIPLSSAISIIFQIEIGCLAVQDIGFIIASLMSIPISICSHGLSSNSFSSQSNKISYTTKILTEAPYFI